MVRCGPLGNNPSVFESLVGTLFVDGLDGACRYTHLHSCVELGDVYLLVLQISLARFSAAWVKLCRTCAVAVLAAALCAFTGDFTNSAHSGAIVS